MCAALYEDEEYYRAQVESIDLLDTTTFVSVFYIDYGNSEHVTLGRCVREGGGTLYSFVPRQNYKVFWS